jgi:hypothetical protein
MNASERFSPRPPPRPELWVHDRTRRTLPLAREATDAVVADFAPQHGPAHGQAQPVLRELYRQRAWLSCGCSEADVAPLWALAARDQHVHLRSITTRAHAPGCPFRESLSGNTKGRTEDAPSRRAELRLSRWQGPLRILHAREPGDDDRVERLVGGRLVRRAHLMQRLLRERFVAAGMDHIALDQHVFLSAGECRSPLRIAALAEAHEAVRGFIVLRWPHSAARLSSWSTGTLVLFVADTLTTREHAGQLHTDCTVRKGPSVSVRGGVAIDAPHPNGEGPWVVLGVLRRDESAGPAYVEAVAAPVLHENLLLPVNDAADRAGLFAVLHGARIAAKRHGVAPVVLRALPFDDAAYPALCRDGIYVLESPGMAPIVLSRLPLPGAVDLTRAPAEILQYTIKRLVGARRAST